MRMVPLVRVERRYPHVEDASVMKPAIESKDLSLRALPIFAGRVKIKRCRDCPEVASHFLLEIFKPKSWL